jgi:hypothetical protein
VLPTYDRPRHLEQHAGAGGGRGHQLAAAVASAHFFLDQLQLPADRAAIVAFIPSPRGRPLTGDHAMLSAALDGLKTAAGTRIDRGILAARES